MDDSRLAYRKRAQRTARVARERESARKNERKREREKEREREAEGAERERWKTLLHGLFEVGSRDLLVTAL